jgi:hypothetical protein
MGQNLTVLEALTETTSGMMPPSITQLTVGAVCSLPEFARPALAGFLSLLGYWALLLVLLGSRCMPAQCYVPLRACRQRGYKSTSRRSLPVCWHYLGTAHIGSPPPIFLVSGDITVGGVRRAAPGGGAWWMVAPRPWSVQK